MPPADPGNDGAFTMSQILQNTDRALEALADDWGDIRESLRPSDHKCNGPSQCYWHSSNKVLAMALCLSKMRYEDYMSSMEGIARELTEEPDGLSDHLKQQIDMLARGAWQWSKAIIAKSQ